MIAIISLVLILAFSLIITRIATIALTHTGLSRESAKFQARSAFTGVGFTTSESEKVVNNPVRRRILLLLMLLGNAGIVTGIASLIIGFTAEGSEETAWLRIVILASCLAVLWTLSQSHWIDKKLSVVITKFLKRYTLIDTNDYAGLLQLAGDYKISEIGIDKKHWLCGKELKKARLPDEGIIVLGITRKDGTYIGTPKANTEILENDSIIIYGRGETMNHLERRTHTKTGDKDHDRMIRKQKRVSEKEEEENETTNK